MRQDKASRGVIARAHQEARRLGARSVEPEHLFVGVMQEERGISDEVRRTFDLDPERIRREVEKLAAPAALPSSGPADMPLSRTARRVIEAAGHEAMDLDCEDTAPEHLLLAVLKHEIVRRALARLGVKPDDMREATLKTISLSPPGTEGEPPGPPGPKEVAKVLIDKLKRHAPDILQFLPLLAELWKRFPGGDLEPKHYRMLLEEQVPAITFIAMIEEKKQRVYVSPQIETILGYTQKEWLKDPSLWYDRLHPEDREAWEREFAATLANRRASVCSAYRFRHRDGHPVWILGNVEIGWEKRKPVYVQATGFDVTVIKENEAKLRRHEEELRQRAVQLEGANRDLERANRELEGLKSLLGRADQREIVHLKSESRAGAPPEKLLLGGSERIQHVRRRILEVASSDAIVLITGETGTGKQLVAQAIHYSSDRKGSFVELNCADFPENLLEDELFGHEKGSYTGADRRRRGCLEQADGGTLFLDEIGDMPKFMQARMLKVLDRRPFRRIGGEENVPPVDVRVICATNRDLKKEAIKDLKRVCIARALESHSGVLTRTADCLQISDRRLVDWMREIGLRS